MKRSTQHLRLPTFAALLFLLFVLTGNAPADADGPNDNGTERETDIVPVIISTLLSGTPTTLYRDADNDTFGDPSVSVLAEPPLNGYVDNNFDCDDSDANTNPGATEIFDGKDNDCDAMIDEGVGFTYYRDADNDTYGNPNISQLAATPPSGYVENDLDCNDDDASVNPAAAELPGDNIDNNCNGVIDESQ